MTATPADGPGVPADEAATLRLSRLLKRPVTDRGGGSLGRLADVIVRLRGSDYPLVTGLVAAVGGREIFVPIDQVSSLDGDPLRLSSARLSLRHFERREGEVLLRADVLGHRLIDVPNARLVRAADLELARDRADWVLTGVDTRPRRMFGLLAPDPGVRAAAGAAAATGATSSGSSGTRAARGCAARSPASAGSSRPRSPTCWRAPRRKRSPKSSAGCTPTPNSRRTSSRNSTRT